jgi:hypothetical protein
VEGLFDFKGRAKRSDWQCESLIDMAGGPIKEFSEAPVGHSNR